MRAGSPYSIEALGVEEKAPRSEHCGE